MTNSDVFADFARSYRGRRAVEMTLSDYLDLAVTDPMAYATAAERMLAPSASRR